MATTYQLLLRRKTELENRMIEAQRRAQAPFESELRAIVLALDALKQAGMAERLSSGEPAAFAPPPTSRRGRRGRTTRDMILMALGQAPGLNEAEIARQLDHRWSRPVTPSAVCRELEAMEMEGLTRRSGPGWIRLDLPAAEAPSAETQEEELPSLSLAAGH